MTKLRVQLRNGLLAVVERCEPGQRAEPVGLFVWLAYGMLRETYGLGEDGVLGGGANYPVADLWREDGRWREDGTDHPLDIVRGLEGAT